LIKKKLQIKYQQIFKIIQNYFCKALYSDRGKQALNYLIKTRGLTVEDIKQWNIGFADTLNEKFISYLKNNNININILEKIDILKKGLYGKYIFFSNRIIFPIFNEKGKTIAFSGRIFLPNDKRSKYINSLNSIIYNKQNYLYNSLYSINKNYIVLVEGYFDVIALSKINIPAVGICGVNLTKIHLNKLISSNKDIYLCLDRDYSGLQATKKILYILLLSEILPKIIILSKKDPGCFMQSNQIENLKKEINKSFDGLSYFIKKIQNKHINNISKKISIIDRFLPYIKAHPRILVKTYYLKMLAKKIKENEVFLYNDFLKIKKQKKYILLKKQKTKNKYSSFEKLLLGFLGLYKKSLPYLSEDCFKILGQKTQNMILKIKRLKIHNIKSITNLFQNDNLIKDDLISNMLQQKNTKNFTYKNAIEILKDFKKNVSIKKQKIQIKEIISKISLAYKNGDKRLALQLQKKIK